LIWKAEPLASGERAYRERSAAGCGSVVVAGDRVLCYVSGCTLASPRVVSDKLLHDVGWVEDVPQELVKDLETARLSERRRKLKDSEVDGYIREFLAARAPELAEKYAAHIQDRLRRGPKAIAWESLAGLRSLRDKEFTKNYELTTAMTSAKVNYYGNEELTQLVARFFNFTDTVICLDAATGKEMWKKEFAGAFTTYWGGLGTGASSTPAIVGDKCYVLGGAALYCLAVKDGALLWQVETKFSNSSPLVVNDAVYVLASPLGNGKRGLEPGGQLSAYHATTGKLLWTQPKVSSSWGSSVVSWTSGDKNYLIGVGTSCIDADTGAIVWQIPGTGGPTTPVISGEHVVVHSDGNLVAYRITPRKAESIWSKRLGPDRGSTPVIYQDHVYVHGDFGARCLSLKDGAEKWRTLELKGEIASPALADGKIIGNGSGATVMYRATPEKFEKLGKFASNIVPAASPTIASGRLYLRLENGIACYDLTGPDQ
jgi:outer membrane protein assembly factor BamB